ncbi:MAG TPA: hypothetical protein DHV31_01790 [Clostridiales bacterium]|nr:hypothetical protein [Clostridiales bacterium]
MSGFAKQNISSAKHLSSGFAAYRVAQQHIEHEVHIECNSTKLAILRLHFVPLRMTKNNIPLLLLVQTIPHSEFHSISSASAHIEFLYHLR